MGLEATAPVVVIRDTTHHKYLRGSGMVAHTEPGHVSGSWNHPHNVSDPSCFSRLSTAEVPSGDSLDYWRQLFTAPRIDSEFSPGIRRFHGELLRSPTWHGVTFVNLLADPHACHFGDHDSQLVLLGHVCSGAMRLRHGHDERAVVTPRSGLVMFDCDRPLSVLSNSRCELSYLALPRSLVTTALCEDPAPRGIAVRTLPDTELGAIVLEYLGAMRNHGERLSAPEAAASLEAATALAVGLLGSIRSRRRPSLNAHGDALYTAACRLLERNIHAPGLTADRVASLLGCSRAHLYRAFARRGRSVAGELRDLRLHRAHQLLQTQSAESIGAIALQCGYTDLSAFGKAFRNCFGVTPSECRERQLRQR